MKQNGEFIRNSALKFVRQISQDTQDILSKRAHFRQFPLRVPLMLNEREEREKSRDKIQF